jgi:hypothetical protein
MSHYDPLNAICDKVLLDTMRPALKQAIRTLIADGHKPAKVKRFCLNRVPKGSLVRQQIEAFFDLLRGEGK